MGVRSSVLRADVVVSDVVETSVSGVELIEWHVSERVHFQGVGVVSSIVSVDEVIVGLEGAVAEKELVVSVLLVVFQNEATEFFLVQVLAEQ